MTFTLVWLTIALGLLTDKPIGNNAWIALTWCTLIALGGYLWSKKLFNREYSR